MEDDERRLETMENDQKTAKRDEQGDVIYVAFGSQKGLPPVTPLSLCRNNGAYSGLEEI